MMDMVAKGLRERTGHDLDEWLAMVEASGIDPLDQLAVRRWLKAEHGALQNTLWAIAAATKARVDLGLRFTDPPASDRLRPAKAPGRSTHKVELTSVDEVDDAVIALARSAYEQNG